MYFIPGLAQTLAIVQLAAILEIIHAAIGIVRSPVFVTSVQVGSRLAALFFVTFSPQAQGLFFFWKFQMKMNTISIIHTPNPNP